MKLSLHSKPPFETAYKQVCNAVTGVLISQGDDEAALRFLCSPLVLFQRHVPALPATKPPKHVTVGTAGETNVHSHYDNTPSGVWHALQVPLLIYFTTMCNLLLNFLKFSSFFKS